MIPNADFSILTKLKWISIPESIEIQVDSEKKKIQWQSDNASITNWTHTPRKKNNKKTRKQKNKKNKTSKILEAN